MFGGSYFGAQLDTYVETPRVGPMVFVDSLSVKPLWSLNKNREFILHP